MDHQPVSIHDDIILSIGTFVTSGTLASLTRIKHDLAKPLAMKLYNCVELKDLDQATMFFKMLQNSDRHTLYRSAHLVKHLQLSFSLRFRASGPSSRSRKAHDSDGRHYFWDIYNPFMDDVQRGFELLKHLDSLNVAVEMERDPTAIARLINMLGDMSPDRKPFVLRLKCLDEYLVCSCDEFDCRMF